MFVASEDTWKHELDSLQYLEWLEFSNKSAILDYGQITLDIT